MGRFALADLRHNRHPPEMIVPHPVYRLHSPGTTTVLDGHDAVAGFWETGNLELDPGNESAPTVRNALLKALGLPFSGAGDRRDQ